MASKIIFLNGCSSAGKTSLVKVIQHLGEEPWLSFGVDSLSAAITNQVFWWFSRGHESHWGRQVYIGYW